MLLTAVSLVCLAQTPDIRVNVREVVVSASVSTRDGAPVQNLRREDFTILDKGQRREIRSFWRDIDLPLTIGLVVDVGGGQVGVIEKERETLKRFLTQVLGPKDRAFLVVVGGHKVRLLTDLTGSVDELLGDLGGVKWLSREGETLYDACDGMTTLVKIVTCGHPLWDGIYLVALKMKELTGRKAMIVISSGVTSGNKRSLTEVIEAAQSADTLVYTMRYEGLSQQHPLAPVASRFRNAPKYLTRLSEETGARAYLSPGRSATMFAEIENDLRSMYVLGFVPPEETDNGLFRKLEVKVANSSLRVRARPGYSVKRF
jgi:Ca-activated chloride channel family protein